VNHLHLRVTLAVRPQPLVVIDVDPQLDAGVAEVCCVLSNAHPRIKIKYRGYGERPFTALAYGSLGLGHQGTRKELGELGRGGHQR
jgi:hypothetical protein